MSSKKTYKCDVCGKPINTDHSLYYKCEVIVHWRDRDTGGETCDHTDVYHVHNDLSKHCMRKLWDILEKHKK